MKKIRFLKRIKMAKGFSLNISKSGAGLSAGPRGMKISRSAKGKMTGSIGIPGSGLSYRTNLESAQSEHEQEVVDEEQESSSLLSDIADKSTYISKHGPVLTSKEMFKSLMYLFVSTLTGVGWIISWLVTELGFLFNPILPLYVVLTLLYVRESNKNKAIMHSRMKEHLKNCNH
jgi:hypothetical protein